MNLLLADILVCPRCGPEFGLILLADAMEERRVRTGRVGCANCREQYPIVEGVVDLRVAGATHPRREPSGDAERALRLAALLGVRGGGGWLVLLDAGVELGRAVGDLLPGYDLVCVEYGPQDGWSGGCSVILADEGVPLRSGVARGVALVGAGDKQRFAEALRVAAPGSHVVLEVAGAGMSAAAASGGARVLLDQGGTLVAAKVAVARG